MGVDNRQRRAKKKREREARRTRQQPHTQPHAQAHARPHHPFTPEPSADDARSVLLEVCALVRQDAAEAARLAALLADPSGPLPPALARTALTSLLAEQVHAVVRGGWLPSDLAEAAGRRQASAHLPMLLGLLAQETLRYPAGRVAQAWLTDLEGAGAGVPLDLSSGLQAALELGALLGDLPALAVLVPPPGTATAAGGGSGQADARVLAKVRALLAKAESSEFPEEAELLSAKAQELVSRHALEQLLDAPEETAAASARRVWLAAPYVFQKGLLVDAVASANRCRSVLSESLGVCTVVGLPGDLAAVDLLVTSLLVQAATAMRLLGSRTDRAGTSRTRSFRQSFLVAYAQRIGERLTTATVQAGAGTGRAGELVPVLRRHAEHVDDACRALFPELVSRPVRIANGAGWAAGLAAADQARLDTAAHLRGPA